MQRIKFDFESNFILCSVVCGPVDTVVSILQCGVQCVVMCSVDSCGECVQCGLGGCTLGRVSYRREEGELSLPYHTSSHTSPTSAFRHFGFVYMCGSALMLGPLQLLTGGQSSAAFSVLSTISPVRCCKLYSDHLFIVMGMAMILLYCMCCVVLVEDGAPWCGWFGVWCNLFTGNLLRRMHIDSLGPPPLKRFTTV